MYSRAITIILVVCIILPGCDDTGYHNVNGSWSYVVSNKMEGFRDVASVHADAESFQVLDRIYGKDRNSVFRYGLILEGAEPSTFELVHSDGLCNVDYSKDAKSVFLFDSKIEGADPKTFEVVTGPYSRDAATVFCGTVPMKDVSVEDFEVVHLEGTQNTNARDIVEHFFGPSAKDIELPAVLGVGWARDGAHYYYGPVRVEGIDYDSFHVIGYGTAADKHGKLKSPFWQRKIPPQVAPASAG